MNPLIIIAFLGALIGSYFYGHHQGALSEKAVWEVRENKELVAANAKIIELNNTARAKEMAHAAEVTNISTKYEGDIADEKAKTAKLTAAVRAGSIRLRDNTRSKETCGGSTTQTAAAASERNGETGAYLSTEASEFLLGLTGEADSVVNQLTACQAVVIDDRR